MQQIFRRTLGQVAFRKELWNGNRERWRDLLSRNRKSRLCPGCGKHRESRESYRAAATDPGNARLTFVHLTSRRDIARFFGEVPGSSRQ
jgi:hypothetical protein